MEDKSNDVGSYQCIGPWSARFNRRQLILAVRSRPRQPCSFFWKNVSWASHTNAEKLKGWRFQGSVEMRCDILSF